MLPVRIEEGINSSVLVGMPALVDHILLSPNVQNDDVAKANRMYKDIIQYHSRVPIGVDITPTNNPGTVNWLNWIKSLPNTEDGQYANKLGCSYVKEILATYDRINTTVAGTTASPDILPQENYSLQNDVNTLTQQRDELLEDAEVATLRDTALRSGNGSISNHQVYLLGRPLRPATIPYLWALSVLFIGVATLIFYMFYPYTIPPIDIILFDLYLLFSSPWLWSILFGLASVVILFLSLRIANII